MKIYERFRFGIFDCDGTLIQTRRSYENSVLTKLLLVSIRKLLPLFVLSKLESLVLEIFDLIGEKIRYLLFLNMGAVLEILKEQELLLVISSASQQNVLERKLKDCNIYSHFDLVMGAPKGEQHVRQANELFFEIDFFEKTFFIGDGLNDMKIAKNCDLYAIGITNSYSAEALKKAGADVVIRRIEELLELEF